MATRFDTTLRGSSAKARWTCCVTLSLAAVLGSIALADQPVTMPSGRAPVSVGRRTVPLRAPIGSESKNRTAPSFRWSVLDTAPLIAQDMIRDRVSGAPLRVGVNRAVPGVPLTSVTDGQWDVELDGSRVWRLSLRDPGAKAIRVSFSRFDLPVGGVITLRGASAGVDVYKGNGPLRSGAFWAAAVKGDVAYVEYRDASGTARDPIIAINEISHIYRSDSDTRAVGSAGTGGVTFPCHVDVNCEVVDPVARDAVGRMEFTVPGNGTFKCSGVLLNDSDPNTFTGYFLTARHCLSTQAAADTLTVYWFYQSAVCDGPAPDLFSVPKSLGAVFLGGSGVNDSTLLRLLDDPHLGQGFAAWTTTPPAVGSTITVIHHPEGTFKRLAAGPVTTDAPFCDGLSLSDFVYNDWTPGRGVTEVGSSGGPLFNEDWEVVGQLFGTCFTQPPGCANPSVYNALGGRFSATYPTISTFLDTITPDDAFEDNDDTASAPTLAEGTHPLTLVDLDDYFNVTITESSVFSATVTFDEADMNVEVSLVHPNGVVIETTEAVGGSASVSVDTLPGDYVVRISKIAGWGGNYTLELATTASATCVPAPEASAETNPEAKNRYLSFVAGDDGGTDSAIGVWMLSLNRDSTGAIGSPDFSAFEGQVRYVGAPQLFNSASETPSAYYVAQLQCDPYYTNWSQFGLIHITGPAVVPGSTYEIGHVRAGCDLANPGNFSGPVVVTTREWGNVVGLVGVLPDFVDIGAIVEKFSAELGAISRFRAQLQPDSPDPDADISFSDINRAVLAFTGQAYPYSGPQVCP